MRLTEIVPARGEVHDVSDADGRAWLAERYAPFGERMLRLNMITSLTGAATGADGTSDTLTSRVDRKILGVIRAAADGVLIGAASVRVEGYVLPRHGRLAVLTTTGDLAGNRLADGGERVVLVCPHGREDAVHARAALSAATVIGVPGDGAVFARGVLDALADEGLGRLVCEGGPQVAGLFAAAGVVDEYCISVAPVLPAVERPFLPLAAGAVVDTEVAGMLVDEAAFSYLRLRPRR